MEREDLAAWLRLSLAPGVGNVAARKLLTAFGLPDNIFRQSESALCQVVDGRQAQALLQEPPGFSALLETTSRWLAQADESGGRAVVALGDPGYPQSLLTIEDPPVLLYLLGASVAAPGLDAAWQRQLEHAIAIVGSRNPTPQGALHARGLARACSEAGLAVVSGLALGIDAAAHEGALQGALEGSANGERLATVAVVGTGLDHVYPRRHLALAHRIARHGLIVSEYPLGTRPLAQNFPRRNRLIAGLSRATLVVEAALQSGSLITARMANEQGRDVFAMPGSVDSVQSRGCHALIKQGAKLVETAQDIFDELRLPAAAARPAELPEVPAVHEPPEDADALLQALGYGPVGLDALVARTGWAAAALQARLLEFELEGWVARLPGGLFQRIGTG